MLLLSLQAPAAEAIETVDDLMLQQAGEFEVGNGQSKTLAHRTHESHYRICVRKARYSVPLKVLFDGKEEIIGPGDCGDVEGTVIKVAPGAKLDGDTVLIGRYHHLG